MKEMKVEITFQLPVLGSSPANEDCYADFVAVKAPTAATFEDELEAACTDEYEGRGMTVFPKLKDGTPFLYDYQIKGFFKSACFAMRQISDAKFSPKIKAYKKKIDLLVFVDERKIPLVFDGDIELKSRSLRAQTMQGERITIATSEMVPEGAKCCFTVRVLEDSLMDAVREWLDYGKYNGIGCWRNSGMGKFEWEEI